MPMSVPALRYAVLHHVLPEEPAHYDLLLSVPEQELLLAWRMPAWPPPQTDEGEALRLPDHRCLYLIYEGPISSGRGDVRQVESGTVQFLERSAERLIARLHSDAGALRCLELWSETTSLPPCRKWKARVANENT